MKNVKKTLKTWPKKT